jgi:uncharacterized protein
MIFNDTKFNLQVKDSLIESAGLGVFTSEFIPKGTIIGKYTGKIRHSSEKFKNTDYCLSVSGKICIDAIEYPRSYMAMLNDAFKSPFSNNCIFKKSGKTMLVVANTDLDVGDELLVSYGPGYWDSR